MKIKSIAVLVLMFALIFPLWAANVSKENTRAVALSFASSDEAAFPATAKAAIEVAAVYSVMKDAVRLYDIINFSQGGWVMVAAEDRVCPVLAYSPQGSLDPDKASPELAWWLSGYSAQIIRIIEDNLSADPAAAPQWAALLSGNTAVLRSGSKAVTPLLTSTWDQGNYYNYYCPEDPAGPGGKVWSGCVATCMAQVMYYYRYPQQGTGSHSYYSSYGSLSANFGATTYDWGAMRDNICNTYNLPMALLQYHCGIAVDMNYAPDGSGAYMDDAAQALISYFGYSSSTNLKNKNSYSNTQWENMLKTDLDAKRPICYAGYGDGGGHAFVCDGYDATGKFHFNFGWSGAGDGYYTLANLAPSYDFSNGQQAILNIYPASSYPYGCTGSTTFTTLQGSIEDGSGPIADYSPNSDCYYLIDPDLVVDKILLQFRRFSTESGSDLLTIYDGPSTSSPVLGTYSGNSLPADLYSTADQVLLHFTSGAAGNMPGWLVEYKGVLKNYCPYLTELTTATGNFSDGSDAAPYNNSTSCRWRIAPPGATGITISFNTFDLDADDFVMIYDEISNTLLAKYTGNTLPASVFVYSPKAFIIFMSSSMGTAQGFDASYISSTSGVADVSGQNLLISPNPATDHFSISLSSASAVTFTLRNAMGQMLKNSTQMPAGDRLEYRMDVSDVPAGLYFLTVDNGVTKSVHTLSVTR
jgi:hypothetical protein